MKSVSCWLRESFIFLLKTWLYLRNAYYWYKLRALQSPPQIQRRLVTLFLGVARHTKANSLRISTQKESIQSLLIALSTIQRLSKILSVKYPYYPPEVITDACVNGYYRGVRRSHVAIV